MDDEAGATPMMMMRRKSGLEPLFAAVRRALRATPSLAPAGGHVLIGVNGRCAASRAIAVTLLMVGLDPSRVEAESELDRRCGEATAPIVVITHALPEALFADFVATSYARADVTRAVEHWLEADRRAGWSVALIGDSEMRLVVVDPPRSTAPDRYSLN